MGLSSDQRSAGTGVEQQEERFSWRPTSRSQELRGWTQIHLVCQLKDPDLLPIKSGSHLERNTKPSEARKCTARVGQPRFLRCDSAASDSLRWWLDNPVLLLLRGRGWRRAPALLCLLLRPPAAPTELLWLCLACSMDRTRLQLGMSFIYLNKTLSGCWDHQRLNRQEVCSFCIFTIKTGNKYRLR